MRKPSRILASTAVFGLVPAITFLPGLLAANAGTDAKFQVTSSRHAAGGAARDYELNAYKALAARTYETATARQQRHALHMRHLDHLAHLRALAAAAAAARWAATHQARQAVTAPAAAPARGGSYGHPYYCGDGDGDGWDMPCSQPGRSGGPASIAPVTRPVQHSGPVLAVTVSGAGTYSYSGLEALWVSAGGPSWAEAHAAEIAECESGGRVNAYNPSGATGLWQILGSVVPGNLDNPYVNALNAVAKFQASGDTFAQWVCQ